MTDWPPHPTIYEINTWVWLAELSARHKRPITLADVPPAEWDTLAEYGFDAIWLMGVWERSPAGMHIAREHPGLQGEYRRALPDYTRLDVVGSPFAVHRYVVDTQLGGPDGLAAARQSLAERGIKLLLDYVPNHVAVDHPWIAEHPEYFVQGTPDLLAERPGYFFPANGKVFAHGRDPHFPAWTDTAQLNAFHPDMRGVTINTLHDIAGRCDGVRCDMAMLLVNRIFGSTWGELVGQAPAVEFWWTIIQATRREHPGFLFMAEAYWDMEWELQQQGFDYCYDKRLYDRLRHDTGASVRLHLTTDPAYQSKLVRFIENHDEPRAADAFPHHQERAAAVTAASLPGARLFHDGQFEGFRVRLPVQLGRRPPEPIDGDLRAFYRTLLAEISKPLFKAGDWQLCPHEGWPDNPTWQHIVAWCWRHADERRLIAVNLSAEAAQAHVRLPWDDLGGAQWKLSDCFSGDTFLREGETITAEGLYVGLGGYGLHFLRFEQPG